MRLFARKKVAAADEPRRKRRRFGGVRRLIRFTLLAAVAAALWAAVFVGVECYSGQGSLQQPAEDVEAVITGVNGYTREEASTYLTLPEWYIVYNTDEYATFVEKASPSQFPYLKSVTQFWRYYSGVCDATRGKYPFSTGDHVMLAVIGTSFSVEYLLKSAYENTIGRLTAWASGIETPEDAFAARTAREYGVFMHTTPWYDFPFASRLRTLWRETPRTGPRVRGWERRFALSAEYGAKAVYGWVIRKASKSAYGDENLRIHAWVENAGEAVFKDDVIRRVKQVGPRSFIVTIPRYEAFTAHVVSLVDAGVRFNDIAGNDEILATVVAPHAVRVDEGPVTVTVVLAERLLIDPARYRVALRVPVRSIHQVIPQLRQKGVTIEHFYDY